MEYDFYTLGVLYLVYSFAGWVGETVVATVRGKHFANRGAAAGHADHADARIDGGADQFVAGVGDAGCARIGDDGDALALLKLLDEPLRLAVFVELVVGGELVAADAELVEQHDAATGVLRRDDVCRL